ncbi:MAG: CoA transferase [Desulfobacteraceae bacterium]|nr:CoA transferase [Desulfobacteraceae bacterium]
MKQSLENIRVLDFSRVLAGPVASMMLGDLGAEVVKVEPPQGDESRTWPPLLKRGESGYFAILNRNKRSLSVNLKDPKARDIVVRLATCADVVLENFTPGVADKLGIGYDLLKAANPGLVYCSISGFGQSGPYRDKKAYDPIIQGMTGLMSITGERGGPPVKIGIPITDLVAANQAVVAVLAALLHRERTGEGQYIDVALYDGMISLLTIMAMDYFATGKPPERWGLDHIHRVPARAFEAGDGRYVQVAATSDAMYAAFCRIIGAEDLIEDPRFCSNALRVQNREQIMPILEEKMREKTADQWLALFEAAGIPCGPVMDMAEVFADPNIAARNLRFDMPHPVEGSVAQLGFPFRMQKTPATARRRPPLLGEHNLEVAAEWLGLTEEEVAALQGEGVL